jgi:hypothetical protein
MVLGLLEILLRDLTTFREAVVPRKVTGRDVE